MDAMNLLGLTCAVLAALAFGVLVAYTLCQLFFTVMRIHARSLRPAVKTAPVEAQAQAS